MQQSGVPTRLQADNISLYLVGALPSAHAYKLYDKVVELSSNLTALDQRILNLAFSHPSLLGSLDGGAALLMPHAELHRRVYGMLAILEASPELSEKFFPVNRGRVYMLAVAWHGARAIARTAFGIILLTVLKVVT